MVLTASLERIILESAKEVFESMVFMPLDRSMDSGPQTDETAFLATITFTGDLEGCFGICCSPACVRSIAASMLCLETDAPLDDREMTDAIGEIANMIMGSIKTRVQSQVAKLDISIPSVIHGRRLKNRPGESMSRVAVPVTIGQQHRAELSLQHRRLSR